MSLSDGRSRFWSALGPRHGLPEVRYARVVPSSGQRIRSYGAVSLLTYALLTSVSHSSIPYGPKVWLFLVLITIATASPLVLFILMNRTGSAGSPRDAQAALRYAMAFGVVSAMATTVFGADFWYYLAEGRLGASGGNVYREVLTAEAINNLPVADRDLNTTMPYGPLWTWISTLVSAIVAPHVGLEFAAYKGLMFAAWLATLRLVYDALADSSALQFRAVLLLGWMPFPLIAGVVDAHNDMVMVALVTFWLVRGTGIGAVALVGSALIKYVSAAIVPLAVFDAVITRSGRVLFVLGLAIAAAAIVIFLYWQDGALIAGLRRNQAWRQYTPIGLLDWMVRAQVFPEILATIGKAVWRVALLGLVVWYADRHRRAPSPSSRAAVAAALFVAIALGAGYMHTHYFLWVLPAVLLASDRFLMGLAIPYVLWLPFMQLLRVSGGGLSTPFRLTATLNLLVVLCWIAYAWFSLRRRRFSTPG